jgi:hypothetical protein
MAQILNTFMMGGAITPKQELSAKRIEEEIDV